jgi:hypothetical protein
MAERVESDERELLELITTNAEIVSGGEVC